MQNWKVTPAEVFAASPLVPVMVINDLEQALPMAKALLEWETIDGEQIEDIMQGRPPRAPKDWSGSTPPSGGGSGSGTAPAVGGEAATTTA